MCRVDNLQNAGLNKVNQIPWTCVGPNASHELPGRAAVRGSLSEHIVSDAELGVPVRVRLLQEASGRPTWQPHRCLPCSALSPLGSNLAPNPFSHVCNKTTNSTTPPVVCGESVLPPPGESVLFPPEAHPLPTASGQHSPGLHIVTLQTWVRPCISGGRPRGSPTDESLPRAAVPWNVHFPALRKVCLSVRHEKPLVPGLIPQRH